MRVWGAALAASAAAMLGACVTTPPAETAGTLPLSALPGWAAEDHAAAFAAARRACTSAPPATSACRALLAQPSLGEAAARAFFEARFRAEPAAGEGLLTGYFAPLYDARRAADAEFSAPVRPKPADPEAAGDRAAIEGAAAADALAWMRPEDLYLLQVQGSGVLVFPDRSRSRAAFAAANGRTYVAIAGPMAARGLLGADRSASAVHAWLAAHRGPEADAVMDLNPRYIFFRLSPDDGGEPTGAAGAPLIAGRSVAVDPAAWPYFQLLWIDADAPTLPGARPVYRRLAVALDAGAAIKGPSRADLYDGAGAAAGDEAGRIRHRLRLYRIVPAP